MHRILMTSMLVCAFLVATDTAALAKVKYCPKKDFPPGASGVVFNPNDSTNYKVRNLTCAQGKKIRKRYKEQFTGATGGAAPKPYGYRCRGKDGLTTCRKGKRSVTFKSIISSASNGGA